MIIVLVEIARPNGGAFVAGGMFSAMVKTVGLIRRCVRRLVKGLYLRYDN